MRTSNNLTWSILGSSDDGESINHSTRLLGRRGVMRVNLVTSSEEIDAALPVFNEMLGDVYIHVREQVFRVHPRR